MAIHRKNNMDYLLSHHPEKEMKRRGIPLAILESVLAAPQQKTPGNGAILCRQSQVHIGGKMYLVRVMVNETVFPPVVVTVYRTSRIAKYWEVET